MDEQPHFVNLTNSGKSIEALEGVDQGILGISLQQHNTSNMIKQSENEFPIPSSQTTEKAFKYSINRVQTVVPELNWHQRIQFLNQILQVDPTGSTKMLEKHRESQCEKHTTSDSLQTESVKLSPCNQEGTQVSQYSNANTNDTLVQHIWQEVPYWLRNCLPNYGMTTEPYSHFQEYNPSNQLVCPQNVEQKPFFFHEVMCDTSSNTSTDTFEKGSLKSEGEISDYNLISKCPSSIPRKMQKHSMSDPLQDDSNDKTNFEVGSHTMDQHDSNYYLNVGDQHPVHYNNLRGSCSNQLSSINLNHHESSIGYKNHQVGQKVSFAIKANLFVNGNMLFFVVKCSFVKNNCSLLNFIALLIITQFIGIIMHCLMA